MKFVFGLSCFILTFNVFALSCNTYERDVKIVCNEYSSNGNPDKLKKLCNMGNMGVIKNKFAKGPCDTSNIIAKCVVKSQNTTAFYYKGNLASAEELESGCKFFKDAVFTNISAKSKPGSVNRMNEGMKLIKKNPRMKKFMECAKSAKDADGIKDCQKLLK